MNTKFLRKTALLAAVLILLCSIFCISSFATGEDLTEPPAEPETQQHEEPQPPEITEEQHTESITIEIVPVEPVTKPEPQPTQAPKPTQSTTKPQPKPTETQKPKPTQAQRPEEPVEEPHNNPQPVNNGTQNENRNPDGDAAVTKKPEVSVSAAAGTTQSLTNADGTFYAYIELNNGLNRQKHRMSAPDLLPEPDMPERKGFNFAGWYADPEFKKKWNFEKDIAKPGCILYAKWEDDGTDKTVYSISVSKVTGGKVEVNPTKAQPGETVNITVTPNDGMRLKPGGLKVNGESTDFLSFKMTSGNVKITAEFEPVSEQGGTGKTTNITVIILIAVFVLLAAFAVFMFMRRRAAAADEEDEESDSSWVDESVVVEAGFKNGDKVAGSDSDDDEDDVELVSLDDIYSDEPAQQTDSKPDGE